VGEFLGRYELLHRLGAGGMGEVFLARQQGMEGFEKFVVVKTLLPNLNDNRDFVKMFFDEARIASMLCHPNIAQIYDLDEASGRYFIAMEYVHGESLRATMRAAQAVPGGIALGLKCRIIAGAAQALDYAHGARDTAGQPLDLIHRDISPGNIMIAFSGGVKLVDFGVAKANNKLARTAAGTIRGTYAYMSPEQALGSPLDRRSDVFSLGIVFHELLTGQRLFSRDTLLETIRAVVEAPIPLPSSIVRGIPKALDAIVLKALARDVADRYPSCAGLRADLEALIERQRLPAMPSRLAAFMAVLFPESSAPDALFKRLPPEPLPLGEQTHSLPGAPAVLPPPLPPRDPQAMLDPAQLEARIAGCAPTDKTVGLFFNAIEAAVLRKAGVLQRAEVRKAARNPKEWVDALEYPTRELLRVLWRGVGLLAPKCGGIEGAFNQIGEHLFVGLAAEPKAQTAATLLAELLALIATRVEPGVRQLGAADATSATVVFKGEVLPLQLYAGLFRAAFAHLHLPTPAMKWQKTMPERLELEVRW
jgi:serine/threonine-protein kinase